VDTPGFASDARPLRALASLARSRIARRLSLCHKDWGGDAMTQRIVVLVAAACFFLVVGFVLWWR